MKQSSFELALWKRHINHMVFNVVLLFQTETHWSKRQRDKETEAQGDADTEGNTISLSSCISRDSAERFHHNFPTLCQLIRKSKHAKVSLISLQSYR